MAAMIAIGGFGTSPPDSQHAWPERRRNGEKSLHARNSRRQERHVCRHEYPHGPRPRTKAASALPETSLAAAVATRRSAASVASRVLLVRVALLPRVATQVITYLPETGSVHVQELEGRAPFGALPEVQARHGETARTACSGLSSTPSCLRPGARHPAHVGQRDVVVCRDGMTLTATTPGRRRTRPRISRTERPPTGCRSGSSGSRDRHRSGPRRAASARTPPTSTRPCPQTEAAEPRSKVHPGRSRT